MALAAEHESAERIATSLTEQDALTEQDVATIRVFHRFLRETGLNGATLVGIDGETIEIPAPIARVLRRIVPLMATGAAIDIVPVQQEVTAQQAADLLNISRPSLMRLLNTNEIPGERLEGGEWRISLTHVMRYKQHRSAIRRAAFAEIAAVGEAYNAYAPDADDGLFDIEVDDAADGHQL